jgi:hypothetical protein
MTDVLISLIKIKDRYFTADRLEDLKSHQLSGAKRPVADSDRNQRRPHNPAATAIALRNRNSGSLRKLPISS